MSILIKNCLSSSVKIVTICISVYYRELLSDAEVGENFGEDGVGGDFASDFADPVEAFAYVLIKQVAAQAALQAVDGAADGVAGMCQCLIMTGIGDNDSVAVHLGQGGSLDDEGAQGFDVVGTLGANGDNGGSLGEEAVQFTSRGKVIVKVGLVEDGDKGLAVAADQYVMYHAGIGAGNINDP